MQNSPNKIDLMQIIREAVNYWLATLRYQVVFSIFYFSLLMILGTFAFNYFGLYNKVEAFSNLLMTDQEAFQKKSQELALTPEFQNFVTALIFIKALIFPLNIGLLQIYRNIDMKEEVTINDLFTGYMGQNFFRFLSYGIFANILYFIASSFFPLNFVWVLLSVFVSPLMLFANQGMLKAIQLNFKALQGNFVTIAVICLISIIFSYSGALFFGVGLAITFPFWNATIYVLYKTIFNEIK